MTIPLVRLDQRPYVTLTLTSEADGSAIDISGATVKVSVRRNGSTTVVLTTTCELVTPAAGVCRFHFAGSALDLPGGSYQAEVAIKFPSGDVQTVYDLLMFQVRERLAPVPA